MQNKVLTTCWNACFRDSSEPPKSALIAHSSAPLQRPCLLPPYACVAMCFLMHKENNAD